MQRRGTPTREHGSSFDPKEWAEFYARRHYETDDQIKLIAYLSDQSPRTEIRLIEVNEHLPEMPDEFLEPIDFGVDHGSEYEHSLVILDVTPDQWSRMIDGELILPPGWSLKDRHEIPRGKGDE